MIASSNEMYFPRRYALAKDLFKAVTTGRIFHARSPLPSFAPFSEKWRYRSIISNRFLLMTFPKFPSASKDSTLLCFQWSRRFCFGWSDLNIIRPIMLSISWGFIEVNSFEFSSRLDCSYLLDSDATVLQKLKGKNLINKSNGSSLIKCSFSELDIAVQLLEKL